MRKHVFRQHTIETQNKDPLQAIVEGHRKITAPQSPQDEVDGTAYYQVPLSTHSFVILNTNLHKYPKSTHLFPSHSSLLDSPLHPIPQTPVACAGL